MLVKRLNDGGMGYTIHVWNGQHATRTVVADAIVKAYELERVLRSSSSLWSTLFRTGVHLRA